MMALYHVFTSATNLEKWSLRWQTLVKKNMFFTRATKIQRTYNELCALLQRR